jgi:hypothetical protein
MQQQDFGPKEVVVVVQQLAGCMHGWLVAVARAVQPASSCLAGAAREAPERGQLLRPNVTHSMQVRGRDIYRVAPRVVGNPGQD